MTLRKLFDNFNKKSLQGPWAVRAKPYISEGVLGKCYMCSSFSNLADPERHHSSVEGKTA